MFPICLAARIEIEVSLRSDTFIRERGEGGRAGEIKIKRLGTKEAIVFNGRRNKKEANRIKMSHC